MTEIIIDLCWLIMGCLIGLFCGDLLFAQERKFLNDTLDRKSRENRELIRELGKDSTHD